MRKEEKREGGRKGRKKNEGMERERYEEINKKGQRDEGNKEVREGEKDGRTEGRRRERGRNEGE